MSDNLKERGGQDGRLAASTPEHDGPAGGHRAGMSPRKH